MKAIKKGAKRGKYLPKSNRIKHSCDGCGVSFHNTDAKGRWCDSCRKPRRCRCGCGEMVKTPGYLYSRGCQTRGKTHEEIYGTSTPTNGFKQGKDNPMRNRESLEKNLHATLKEGNIYKGRRFRSSWEVDVYRVLEARGIEPLYEPTIRIGDRWLKPDFVVENVIYEVSGYASAFEKSRLRNKKKIEDYLKYTGKEVVFITAKRYIKWYESHFKGIPRIRLVLFDHIKTEL